MLALSLRNVFAARSCRLRSLGRLIAPRSTATLICTTLSCAIPGCASPIHRLHLLRASRLRASRPVSLPSSLESLTSGTQFPRKSFLLRTYEKRSSGQDGRPESRLGDEGSLRGALLRNVTMARENKCFILRTYKKTAYNSCKINTYRKIGGGGPPSHYFGTLLLSAIAQPTCFHVLVNYFAKTPGVGVTSPDPRAQLVP